ncbi:hypothetical protein PF005_g27157 [Phytophthora fragariae]|uniref:Uncharacterized protein n=1 Tax=Phytophthora fragariae TaxID=53985 RepID=A0A6A3VQ68_9STRA|nr:hypothetical protein PF009_g8493 [Phytophthora fragariae]KAE9022529.1 hypothetical protein PF011_g4421 [Phytophthora fragariae]KAE9171399.1 hypothetical protein PF005_g27157 [Phytophthora fragariae]KAE9244773.1 hypothetical protein PF004_g5529 [Phytophthora fragariae]
MLVGWVALSLLVGLVHVMVLTLLVGMANNCCNLKLRVTALSKGWLELESANPDFE